MNKKKLLYGGAALLAVLIMWAVLTVPKPPTEEEVAKDAKKFMEYNNQSVVEEKKGKRIWDITTERSKVEIATNNAEFFNIVGHFYSDDGKTLEVKATHGFYNDKNKDITLDEGVKATRSDGAVLTGEKIVWQGKQKILSAVGKAKFTKDDFIAEGDKIDGYDGFEEFKITGHAHIMRKNRK